MSRNLAQAPEAAAFHTLLQQADEADIRLTPGMAEGLARGNPRMIAYVAQLIAVRGKRPAIEPRENGGPLEPGKTYTINEQKPEAVVGADGSAKQINNGQATTFTASQPGYVLPDYAKGDWRSYAKTDSAPSSAPAPATADHIMQQLDGAQINQTGARVTRSVNAPKGNSSAATSSTSTVQPSGPNATQAPAPRKPQAPASRDKYSGNSDDYSYFGPRGLTGLSRQFSPTSEVDAAEVRSLMLRGGYSNEVTERYLSDLKQQARDKEPPPGPTTGLEDMTTEAAKRIANLSNKHNIANGGKSYDEPASDKDVTASQLFYEWAHGHGPDKRLFDENSVMGKQMLGANYVVNGMNEALENAKKGVFKQVTIERRLGKDNIFQQALYPVDFAWDASGHNPARAFQGSIKGKLTPGAPYTTKDGTFVPLQIEMNDNNTAASGTRLPPFMGGYGENGSLVPQENPYGSKGPLRTLQVQYRMRKDVPLQSPPLSHTPTFGDAALDTAASAFRPKGLPPGIPYPLVQP